MPCLIAESTTVRKISNRLCPGHLYLANLTRTRFDPRHAHMYLIMMLEKNAGDATFALDGHIHIFFSPRIQNELPSFAPLEHVIDPPLANIRYTPWLFKL